MARNLSTSETKLPKQANAAGKFLRAVIVVAVVIIALSAWMWWHNVRSNPRHVFEAMLANSLKTTGASRHITQSGDGQQLDQTVEFATSPSYTARALTTLSQSGDNSASVVTETIGTPFADYVRYLDIISSQKNTEGKSLDFSKVKNIWGKTNTPPGNEVQTNGELYNESVLGVVPVANLPAAQRKALLAQIKTDNVYSVDYANVSAGIKNGRPTYIYTVTVKPQPYVAMLKALANDMGLTQLETVDPASYANSSPLQFTITVDVWSQQLRSLEFGGGARTETASGYGINSTVSLPQNTIPIDELQTRVQAIH